MLPLNLAKDQANQQVTEAGGDMKPLKRDHYRHAYRQQKNDLNQMIQRTYPQENISQ
jgi:hypothetical protein